MIWSGGDFNFDGGAAPAVDEAIKQAVTQDQEAPEALSAVAKKAADPKTDGLVLRIPPKWVFLGERQVC